jgi:hypothetical protein
MKKLHYSLLIILTAIFSCSKEPEKIEIIVIDEGPEPNLIVKKNSFFINSTVSSIDLQRIFSIVSGVFPYESDGEFYSFFAGAADWVAGYSDEKTKNEIPPISSQILKRVDGKWEFFKTDTDAYFWGARNFKIIGNQIAIGDGNEIGPDGPGWSEEPKTERNWSGDMYFGKIQEDGNILWKVVNNINNRVYFHGTTLGDINGDGLLDVGGAPNPGTNNLKLFVQQPNGEFIVADSLLQTIDRHQPFSLEFFDLDKDGTDEIITASYGGGDPSVDEDLNNIRVYKYNVQTKSFEISFKSNSPTALYSIGMGATSIKCSDLDRDGNYDIIVSREDREGHSFDIWKGLADGTFLPYYASPVWSYDEMQFRELDLFDVNEDGFDDIILRPFAYGSLYRIVPNVPVHLSGGIKLNTIIQINDGTGRFSAYDKEDLVIENLNVQNLHPYMDGDTLHFVGAYTPDRNVSVLETVDIVVRIKK